MNWFHILSRLPQFHMMCLISAFIVFVHIYLNFFVLAKLVIRITFAFVGQYYALKGAADVDASFNIILLKTMMIRFLEPLGFAI